VTTDEIPDPANLGMRTWVNGALRQDSNTDNLIFDVPYLIWYLSRHMVLEPGDVINTGTPAGVALGLPGNPYLRSGDLVELEITGLGTQTQTLAEA
jgi:2-keto-4-pentenoate hydratase/2-oxohepta-3-ene-1,7-dioic acid hydratase in catechol pathway